MGFDIVSTSEIIRCEADRSTCSFFLTDGRAIKVKKNLGFFEDELLEWNFIRVHRSTLVNVLHVKQIVASENDRLVLSDASEIAISKRKKKEVLERLKLMVQIVKVEMTGI